MFCSLEGVSCPEGSLVGLVLRKVKSVWCLLWVAWVVGVSCVGQ